MSNKVTIFAVIGLLTAITVAVFLSAPSTAHAGIQTCDWPRRCSK